MGREALQKAQEAEVGEEQAGKGWSGPPMPKAGDGSGASQVDLHAEEYPKAPQDWE